MGSDIVSLISPEKNTLCLMLCLLQVVLGVSET